ncbi:hypothetical protein LRB86_05200 [Borreliella burgdorferi]|uniref:hypothetical protein n=1 Tax=Borreliella burgdorferi TaxID=139 RepID=UPI001E49A118|nr:hypothetical protein [Borreliella burgdorferi]MCD2413660.1 hypothetical protein [Borreliella burgdorferi]
MNKLLIFIILLVFSCNLSNSDQNNPLNMSNQRKNNKISSKWISNRYSTLKRNSSI